MSRNSDLLYGQFTAPERFRLVVAALARKDLNEVDRLIDSCPRKTYRMPDAAFTEATRGIHILALEFHCRLVRNQGAGLLVLALLIKLRYEGDDAAFDGLTDKLLALDVTTVSIWTAWTQFCARIGVDPDDALLLTEKTPLSFKSGVVAEFLDKEIAREHVAPDPVQVQHYLDMLNDYWVRVGQYGGWTRVA